MANLALVFDILAKDGASGPFRNVGNAAERAGTQTSKFGTAMSGAMKLAGGALLGAGLVEGFKALYNAADESRKIAALTGQVIKSTGGAANVSAKAVGDLASAIAKKTGVDDEAIQSGQNLLLTFTNVRNEVGKGNNIFDQATQTITDMSVALGQDTSSSAIQLGKALNDPIKGVTALQRVGVSFTASQKDQIRTLVESGDVLGAQKIILAELGKEFGGAAEAAATPLGKLQQRLGDLAEQVGGYLVPAVDKAATFFNDKLLPAFSDVGSLVAGVAVPAFEAIGTVIGVVADAFNALPGPLQAAVVALGAFALLKGPISGAFDSFVVGASKMIVSVDKSVASVGVFKAAGAGLMGMFGGPWGLAVTAATIAVVGIGSAMEKTERQTHDWAKALAEGGAAARQAMAELEQAPGFWDRVTLALSGHNAGMGAAAARTREAKEALEEYRQGLDPVAEAQSRVTEWTNTLSDRVENLGAHHEDTRTAQERLAYWTDILAGRQANLDTAVEGATGTIQTFAEKTEESRTALDEAKRAIDDYKLALDILTGTNVSSIQVQAAFQSALAAAGTAMTDLGGEVLTSSGNLNLQSENGRKAADVLLDVRNSGNDLIATYKQQGETTEQLAARDASLRQSFLDTAGQMGITGGNAELLADQILGIPDARNTTITADTTQATTAVDTLQRLIDSLRGRTVDIVANAIGPDLNGAASGSGRFGLATGGPVFGPGTGTSDSIPAMLSNGEHVLTAREVRAAGGHGAISSWRKSLVASFAEGGPVGAPASIVAELDATAYSQQMDTYARQVLDKYEPVQGFIGALQWARSQVGKPYVWGGVGPGGFDCSGFMSAITNVIRGRSPYSRVGSTASFPWGGFGAGSGMFTIGSTRNAGGGIGHMAGTLLGINVESTGGVGVKVGGSARGAFNSLFNTQASLRMANGGVIGEPVSGIGHYSGRSYSFGERGPETVTPGLPGGSTVVLKLDGPAVTALLQGVAVEVATEALGVQTTRGAYNG